LLCFFFRFTEICMERDKEVQEAKKDQEELEAKAANKVADLETFSNTEVLMCRYTE
jgi:hypothetical protein